MRWVQAAVDLMHSVQDLVRTGASALGHGNCPLRRVLGVFAFGQGTRVGLVQVQVLRVDLPVRVVCLFSHEAEKVGTTVPATKRRQAPVGRQGGDDRVQRIESVVFLATQVLRKGSPKEKAKDLVPDFVGVRLVEREEDQRILGEVLVLEQLTQELIGPATGERDVGVMGIVGHVGSDKHVLGQLLVLQVIVKRRKVLDLSQTRVVLRNGLEEN